MKELLITAKRFIPFDEVAGTNEVLERVFDRVTYMPATNQRHSAQEMRRLGSSFVRALVVGDDVINDEALIGFPNLELVVKWGAGTDAIDFTACERNGIRVLNTPGLLGLEVAEVGIGMIINLCRRLSFVSNGVMDGLWPQVATRSATSLSVGLYGFGDIGRSFAKLGHELFLEIAAFDPAHEAGVINPLYPSVSFVSSLDDLLTRSNVLVVCCPLVNSTANTLGRKQLERLKSDRVLIVLSRGGIIDEEAAVSAVETGQLLGLGLDVYSSEPPDENFVARCSSLNVILGSHNSSNATSANERVNRRVVELLESFSWGKVSP